MSVDTRYKTIGGETCQNCGRKYKLCWKAPNEVWLKVTRQKEGVLCIFCFDAIASANNISLVWECKEKTAELVTPNLCAVEIIDKMIVEYKNKKDEVSRGSILTVYNNYYNIIEALAELKKQLKTNDS